MKYEQRVFNLLASTLNTLLGDHFVALLICRRYA